jgi:hypothetical protein
MEPCGSFIIAVKPAREDHGFISQFSGSPGCGRARLCAASEDVGLNFAESGVILFGRFWYPAA